MRRQRHSSRWVVVFVVLLVASPALRGAGAADGSRGAAMSAAAAAAQAPTEPAAPAAPPALACLDARESGLPLPSRFARDQNPAAFQDLLSVFLRGGVYERLGWCVDKSLRDTGPFIDGVYYGTHPVVRIWYSPSFARWLVGGRQGKVPDGAMIVKEQFDTPPAGQYQGWTPEQIHTYFEQHYDWTVMIRDHEGAADGWYWAEAYKGMAPNSFAAPFGVFNAGFGLYCLRCHGSAEKELTFSATTNLAGMPGQPLTFRDDLSWFWNDPLTPPATEPRRHIATLLEGAPLLPLLAGHPNTLEELEATHPRVLQSVEQALHTQALHTVAAHPSVSSDWSSFFAGTHVDPAPHPFPGENYDHVVSPAGKPQHFVTSDQCFGCHSGNRYGNVMLWADNRVTDKPLANVSPYGEWRWSPMGLAGRDPIFHSQLESEIAFLRDQRPEKEGEIVNLCFSCHGAMGQRQLTLDSGGKDLFTPQIVQIRNLADPRFRYGALARDGVSCAVCHHVASTDGKSVMQFIAENSTGQFLYTPAEQLSGPFDKPVTIPMDNSLGIKPAHDAYVQNPRVCGTCHTIELPILDAPAAGHGGHGVATGHGGAYARDSHGGHAGHADDGGHGAAGGASTSFEQATYLEWLNSAYENEIGPNSHPGAKTCQDCHMKGALNGAAIQTQIAAVEDDKYPAAEHRAANADLSVPLHTNDYARHQLQGLNVFLLALFDQWSDDLGVRRCDYMSSGCSGQEPTSGIPFAVRNFLDQAAKETATVAVGVPVVGGSGKATTLTADVTVTNLTGHRFPSGVSFRRAFLDFAVRDKRTGRVLFESGRTNSIGALVDQAGHVLPSERNGSAGPGGHAFQPHFWAPGAPITRSDQVQIYEELLKDAAGNFTTSFVRQDEHFKDNRILPLGWRKSGPDLAAFDGRPLEATWSRATGDDPYYADPLGARGQSVVRYVVPVAAGTTLDAISVTAQLYYQAMPPYYLRQRFEQAPDGPATQRLYYLTSGLDVTKTPFPGWKLLVAQATAEGAAPSAPPLATAGR